MARYIFQGTFRDGQGNIVSGGTITVYLAGTDTTATIYEDDTTVTSTSYVESDDNGYFIFYIDSSDYSTSQFFDIQLAKSGYTTKLYPSISIVPLWPTDETIEVTDNTTNDVSASAHGWTPKLSDSASDFLDGKGNWDAVSDADLEVTDVTTNNASTSAHGFLKKLDNEATHFMDGTGAWDTVKDSDLALTDITDNDVSTTKHGFVPKLPDNPAKFLNGTGNWTTVSGGGGGGTTRQTVLSSSIGSDGKPNFITAGTGLAANIAATTTPIRISFANGFDENGAVDYVGTIDADTSISSLTPSTTNYLFAERNSGTAAITLGKTAVQPIYSYSAPAHASDRYWFSIPQMKMYLSNGSDTWNEVQVTFLGEAVTGGSSVTSVVNYALRGRYVSGLTTVAANTLTSVNHNLGVIPEMASVDLVNYATEAGYAVGESATGVFLMNSGSNYISLDVGVTSKVMYFGAPQSFYAATKSEPDTAAPLTASKWRYRFTAQRGW